MQARACGLMGNLLRHTDEFYSVLKEKEELIEALLLCLISSETDVRKVCWDQCGEWSQWILGLVLSANAQECFNRWIIEMVHAPVVSNPQCLCFID